jgi:uncharacterized protein
VKKNIDYKTFNDNVFFRDTLQIHKISNDTIIELLNDENSVNESKQMVLSRINEALQKSSQPSFASISNYPAITINLTNRCNLTCSYCFAYKKTKVVNFELKDIKSSIIWLVDSIKSDKYSILFFGGEPLLMEDTIQEIVEYCNELKVKRDIEIYYSITTNATLIKDSTIKMFRDHGFFIKISMDGPKHINDLNRKFSNGQGSFNAIMRNITKLKQNGLLFEVRATVSPEYLNLIEIVDFFESNGIPFGFDFVLTPKYKSISFCYDEPVFQKVESEFLLVYQYYCKKIENNSPVFCSNIRSSLSRLYFQLGKKIACDAGVMSFTVNSDGSLYTCQNISNIENATVGNIFKDKNLSIFTELVPNSVEVLNGCKECLYKYLCSGACMADKYIVNNNVVDPVESTCFLRKHYWDSMIMLYCWISQTRPSYFKGLAKPVQV